MDEKKRQYPEGIVLPDYDESILNLSCSILQHYGIAPDHSTLPDADRILAHNYKHVVLILLDGLGMNVLEKNLSYKDFLRRNLVCEYSSVFPPTTTASTTSLLSGKSPIEHGWLGWDVYFEQEEKTVTCFTNTIQGTNQKAAEYDVARKYLPYENIIEKINKKGTAQANAIWPFGADGYPDLHDWIYAIRKSCKTEKRTFTYAYWENPDSLLHKNGSKSNDVAKCVQELNEKLSFLCDECPETVFLVTADHGHIDIYNEYLQEDYPELAKMLVRAPSIEPRAISFYVKPEYMEEFPIAFNEEFGQDYYLMNKKEFLEEKLFGPGTENENLTGIGEYIAIAYKNKTINWKKDNKQFKSHHAGLSKAEMRIPLISFENKPKHIGLVIFYSLIALAIAYIFVVLF